ncbi:hypothetical protein ACIQTT_12230 [Microbacterium sp. NPDC090225]|uniref:hypothetical protein n=1 Tax=Microbacterium sp. NPDC090225 TaxID=3364207 RepID=UPI00383033FC
MLTKKKAGRWQALALAALLLAGGSIAVPQAADAAGGSFCNDGKRACQTTTMAKKSVKFRISAPLPAGSKLRFSVTSLNGAALCSGYAKVGSTRTCSFQYYGKVRIKVPASFVSWVSITVR